MARLGELDIPDRLAPNISIWVTQILTALFCVVMTVVARFLIDIIAPGAGPFAVIYPAVLAATLFSRWQAGIMTHAASLIFVWYFVLPPSGTFELQNASDWNRMAVNASSGAFLILISDTFRRAVRRAVEERNARLVERDLFLGEVDHRVKNNFALVASLLDMQRRRSNDAGIKNALSEALTRVESVAQAHQHLYRDANGVSAIDIKAYLEQLCLTLSLALFLRGSVVIHCSAESATIPRDRVVSIGLIVNELVTNAAKHAFEGRDRGLIKVAFTRAGPGFALTVEDDGRGIPETIREGALGSRLLVAFSHQANGELSSTTGPGGSRFVVKLQA